MALIVNALLIVAVLNFIFVTAQLNVTVLSITVSADLCAIQVMPGVNAPDIVTVTPAVFEIVLLKLVTVSNPVEPKILLVVNDGSNTNTVDALIVNVLVCVLALNLILPPDAVCVVVAV